MQNKKILGLIASPRKTGNSEIAVKAIAAHMPPGWELQLIRLPGLRIEPCRGCYTCLVPGKTCGLKDDAAWLFEQLAQADAYIVSAPDYVLGPAGIWKMLADRSLQASPYYAAIQSKPAVAVLTLGKEDYRGYADTALVGQARVLGMNILRVECFHGTYPGEVTLLEDFPERIRQLAAHLNGTEAAMQNTPQRCPVCLSDLFRLHARGLECALCCSVFSRETDGLHLREKGVKFTDAGMQEHFIWLVEKKQNFLKIKDELKLIQDKYRGGTWLKPD